MLICKIQSLEKQILRFSWRNHLKYTETKLRSANLPSQAVVGLNRSFSSSNTREQLEHHRFLQHVIVLFIFLLCIDVITCVSLDDDGHHLITGSRDTTCRLWGITHQGGVAQEVIRTPLQTLYGHDQRVTCVAMSWELDMAVSGSQVRVTKPLKYVENSHRQMTLFFSL